jgi:hypothetical protein
MNYKIIKNESKNESWMNYELINNELIMNKKWTKSDLRMNYELITNYLGMKYELATIEL